MRLLPEAGFEGEKKAFQIFLGYDFQQNGSASSPH